MKIVLHVVSAFFGLAFAAAIVFTVFGSASEQGASQDGDSDVSVGRKTVVASGCGSVRRPANKNQKVVRQATSNLPTIMNQKGTVVIPGDKQQVTWFARMSAASGLCLTKVHVTQKRHVITASFPPEFKKNVQGPLVFETVREAFKPPTGLERKSIVITTGSKSGDTTLKISGDAWQHFLRDRRRFGLRADMHGLTVFHRKVGKLYGSSFTMKGW